VQLAPVMVTISKARFDEVRAQARAESATTVAAR